MKIALDFAFTLAGGVISYFKEMIRYLSDVDATNEYLLLVTDDGYEKVCDYLQKIGIECVVLPRLKNEAYRFLWEQIELPKLLEEKNVDILYSVNNRVPWKRTKCKKVVLLGTLGPFMSEFLQHFNYLVRIKQKILARLIAISLKRADFIIYESEFTRKLIEKKYGDVGHGVVNYHCRPTDFILGEDLSNDIIRIRDHYKIEREYFLYVTYIRRYKNLERLIDAFALIQDNSAKKFDFIAAGPLAPTEKEDYFDQLIRRCTLRGVEGNFRFIGMVQQKDLLPLSLGAFAYVFPSKFENLSYSLVEALTYGLPIITTMGTAMPETCEDAAIYFEPEDTEGLANAMISLANKPKLRETLKAKSIKQAEKFKDMKGEIRTLLDIFNKITQ